MPESPQPSPERQGKEAMQTALVTVRAAQALLAALEYQEKFRQRSPESYERILRAAVRSLEPHDERRLKLYRLLNCAPEEQG